MFGAGVEEVGVEGDGAGLEEEEGGGSAEGEVAFFVAFCDGLAGGEGLVDGADAGGSDFHAEDGAEGFGFEFGDGAFVFPEVGEALAEGDGGDGEEGAVEGAGFAGGAGAGEVEAVVVDRAESGEEEGAVLVAGGEFRGAEEGGEVKLLSFDKDGGDFAGFGEAEVAAIGGEDDGGVGEGAGGGFEFAVEEVVEGGELVRAFDEVVTAEAVGFEERGDFFSGFGLIHAISVPF